MITIVENFTEKSMNATAEDFKNVLNSKKKLDNLLSKYDTLTDNDTAKHEEK